MNNLPAELVENDVPDAPDTDFYWHEFEESHPKAASDIRIGWMNDEGWGLINEMMANERNHHALIYLGCTVGKSWTAYREKWGMEWLENNLDQLKRGRGRVS